MTARAEDISLLYVEDDEAIRETMMPFLNHRFGQVWKAQNGLEGLGLYYECSPDIILTDIRMPVMDGLTMTRTILQHHCKAPIIVTSAHNESDYLLEAIEQGISHYLLKPLDTAKVTASLQHCVELVRKARMLNERDKILADAYQAINVMIDYGDVCFDTTDRLGSDIEQKLDLVIENFTGSGTGHCVHQPSIIIVTLTHGLAGQPVWLKYLLTKNRPPQRHCYLDHPDLEMLPPDGCHTLCYLNEHDPLPADPFLCSFMNHLEQKDKRPRNLVWYRNGNRLVCAMNYPGQVTACDAVMIKGLAVQTRYLDNLSTQFHQTEEAFHYTITSLARAAEANDEDTGNHILRVGAYCTAICREIGYSRELAELIGRQSQLHDVGKLHVQPELLKKPSRLTDEEMTLVREHTLFGAKIIGNHPRLEIARTIALYHHEHWDGTGYPYGLRESGIPFEARITAIADTYDALRNRRIYKPAFDHDTACRIMLQGDGRTEPGHFDPDLLNTFKKIHNDFDAIYQQLATTPDALS